MIDRRDALLHGLGLTALLATAGHAAVSPRSTQSLKRKRLDLATADGNVVAMAKLTGNLAGEGIKYGYYSGVLMGVVPGEAVRELVGIVGMSSARLKKLPEEPGYLVLQKELGFFTDLATGDELDRWTNPYTQEAVEPFHIANPAVNRYLRPVVRDERFYDRVAGSMPAPKPFILPWRIAGDRAFVESRTHFLANNPLDPKIWVRESGNAKIQVSDCLSYSARFSELADPAKSSVEYWGHWVHVRPWQPWMLMGAAPGHCLYSAATGSARTLDDVPDSIRRLAEARFPDFLSPPTEIRKSEPSMVRYMRERKPAGPRP